MCSTMTIGGMGETTVRELLWHSLIDTYLIPIKTFLGRGLARDFMDTIWCG